MPITAATKLLSHHLADPGIKFRGFLIAHTDGHCQAIHGGAISSLVKASPKTHASSKQVSRILAIYLQESDLSMGRDVAARTELTAAFSAYQQT